MLFLYKMYEPEVGHFCPYGIVSWDKYVPTVLKTHEYNQCQKPRFAVNNILFVQMLHCFIFLGGIWCETKHTH